MSVLLRSTRILARSTLRGPPRTTYLHTIATFAWPQRQQLLVRGYATKNKAKSTATFVPGSKQPITDETARQEYTKCEAAMQTSVDWFRKECAASENRALGRVTPALLSPVRVKLPENPKGVKLEELATIGVREGSTLLVTLFNEHVRLFWFRF